MGLGEVFKNQIQTLQEELSDIRAKSDAASLMAVWAHQGRCCEGQVGSSSNWACREQ